MAVDPVNGDVIVAGDSIDPSTGTASLITTAGYVDTVNLSVDSGAAEGVAVDPTSGDVYVADPGSDTVFVFKEGG